MVVNHGWQSESTDGLTGGWSCVFGAVALVAVVTLLDVVWCSAIVVVIVVWCSGVVVVMCNKCSVVAVALVVVVWCN